MFVKVHVIPLVCMERFCSHLPTNVPGINMARTAGALSAQCSNLVYVFQLLLSCVRVAAAQFAWCKILPKQLECDTDKAYCLVPLQKLALS